MKESQENLPNLEGEKLALKEEIKELLREGLIQKQILDGNEPDEEQMETITKESILERKRINLYRKVEIFLWAMKEFSIGW
jgi:hypothetical protein